MPIYADCYHAHRPGLVLILMLHAPPTSTLFPYTTLFRSRQRVHTYTRRGVPESMIRTRWRLGLNRRFVATIEWLRLWPNAGAFPHEWQTLAMRASIERGLKPDPPGRPTFRWPVAGNGTWEREAPRGSGELTRAAASRCPTAIR